MNSGLVTWRVAWRACLTGWLLTLAVMAAQADASGEKKRVQLTTVKRLLIVSPFFGTDTLAKAFPPVSEEKSGADGKNSAFITTAERRVAGDARLVAYGEQLQKLLAHDAAWLPERVGVRTPYIIISGDSVCKALKTLKLTPQSLFKNGGLVKDRHYPEPDREAIQKLAAQTHADAILLTVLDEPRRTNGHYFYSPLSGLDYETAHVRGKGGLILVQSDGTEILHDYVEVMHPVTRIGARDFLMVDWTEAQDQLIEDFLDELTRYTPEKRN